jgi:pimeloyl-ACP methyl ester carboxylesterase
MRVRGVVTFAVTLVALLVTATDAMARPAATPAASDPAPLVQPSVSPIVWAPCSSSQLDPYDCGTVEVPKDYADPTGEKLKLSVIRKPALFKSARLGAIFMNPGGPGGGVLDFIRGVADQPGFSDLNLRYDLVGFDPRGVGQSAPVHCLDDAQLDASFAKQKPFPDLSARDSTVADATAYAAACEAKSGALLPYLSTKNTARDMDVVRQAIGEKRLTYLGFSYGTYLGATYAALFPHSIRAAVLDGAVDPDAYANRSFEADLGQELAFDRAAKRFFSYCVTECRFGHGHPARAFDALIRHLQRTPLKALRDPKRKVTAAIALDGSITAMYSRSYWPFLGEALQDAADGDGSRLQLLADSYAGRDDKGHYDNSGPAYNSISCIDRTYTREIAQYDNFYRVAKRISKRFGSNFWQAEYNCAVWPAVANDRYTGPWTYSSDNKVPILVVGTTHDPATPYKDAKAMTRELGNAELLTMRGDGHTAFGGNSNCIDLAVIDFLLKRIVPRRGTICTQQVTPPEVTNRGLGSGKGLGFGSISPGLARLLG